MAAFDLGDAVQLRRTVGVGVSEAYRRGQALLVGYERQGYRVRFVDEQPPVRLTAEVTDRSGTRILASVDLVGNATGGAEVELQLSGQITVGGMKGMLATERQVRQVAAERLASFLDAKFPPDEVCAAPAVTPPPADATEPAPPPAVAPPLASAPVVAPNAEGLEAKLSLVKGLFDRGLITEADYRSKKADLLARF